MAKTLNARFFSKPSSLREVEPELFLKFLKLGRSFLQTKGYELPDAPDLLDYEQISSILTDPEGMDETFQNALFQVGELAKQDEVLFDHMQELTKEKPWAPAIDAKATNADFAIAIYLNEPALLNEVHATDLFSSTKSFQYFMAEVDLENYEFKMPSEGMLADLEKALDLGFTEKRRGGSSEVAIKQLGSCVVITVRHGEQFSRQAAIHEGKSTSVFYRPRSPKVGEPVEIDAFSEENGKKKATRARIPGLVPQPNFTSKRGSGPSRYQPRRSSRLKAAAALLVIGGLFWGYNKLTDHSSPMPAGIPTQEQSEPHTQPQQFRCEGKTHCSEMGSKAEAEFYLRNCPNTEMDGDNDGNPCEQQFGGY